MMSLFFENDTERVIRKPEEFEWEFGEPSKHCGKCHVRINALPDKYGVVYCPNGHRNVPPK
jgi:hypothetical protein